MKTNALILVLIGLMISLSSFGQKVFNTDYKIEKENLKLALIPIMNERPSFNDTIMTKIFRDELKNLQIISPSKTREVVTSDTKVQNLLNKIILTDYKKKDLKSFPNLNSIIDEPDIAYLREKFRQADLVLIPIALNFKPMGVYTFGYTKFRMYDLNTGEFIFEFSDTINVNISGENAMKGLTGALVSVAHDYYKSKFLEKHKIE